MLCSVDRTLLTTSLVSPSVFSKTAAFSTTGVRISAKEKRPEISLKMFSMYATSCDTGGITSCMPLTRLGAACEGAEEWKEEEGDADAGTEAVESTDDGNGNDDKHVRDEDIERNVDDMRC